MGYWGYPWANGSGYGYPWGGMGSAYPTAGMPSYYGTAPGTMPSDGAQGDTPGGEGQKTGGITGFFKGIAQGAVNTIKGIFTPQGLLMTAGTAALAVMTGGLILPLLGAVGIGIGAYQVLKGVASGDTEKMGEGVFSLGLSALGFLGGKSATIKAADGTKLTYRLKPSTGDKVGILDRFRALIGKGKYEAHTGTKGAYTKLPETSALYESHGTPLNLYQLSWKKMQNGISSLQKKPPRGDSRPPSSTDSFSRSGSGGGGGASLQGAPQIGTSSQGAPYTSSGSGFVNAQSTQSGFSWWKPWTWLNS